METFHKKDVSDTKWLKKAKIALKGQTP